LEALLGLLGFLVLWGEVLEALLALLVLLALWRHVLEGGSRSGAAVTAEVDPLAGSVVSTDTWGKVLERVAPLRSAEGSHSLEDFLIGGEVLEGFEG